MARVLDGIDAFLDQLASVEVFPLLLAIGCHLAKLACTSMAWRNVLAAAYPETRVPLAVDLRRVPRGGRHQRDHPGPRGRRGPDRPRPPRDSGQHVHDGHLEHARAHDLRHGRCGAPPAPWAIATDALPGLGELPRLESFDFAWLLDRPARVRSSCWPAILVCIAALGIWIHGHVLDFWERVAQAFAVVPPPTRYLAHGRRLAGGDWTLRLATIWFLLDAFDIPQTLENALLVQVSASVADARPDHAGRHRHRAGLPAVRLRRRRAERRAARVQRRREARRSARRTSSPGFTAIALTLRTLRYSKAMQQARGRRGRA